jgi:hypothetical protein
LESSRKEMLPHTPFAGIIFVSIIHIPVCMCFTKKPAASEKNNKNKEI